MSLLAGQEESGGVNIKAEYTNLMWGNNKTDSKERYTRTSRP